MTETLRHYLNAFARLHRAQRSGSGSAPHKPILLLALLGEAEHGRVTDNLFTLTPELVASFQTLWRALVTGSTWQPKIIYPFRYLIQEGFWQLVRNGQPVPAADLGHPTSIGQLSGLVDGGRFTPDLWHLLQDAVALGALRHHLVATYFPEHDEAAEHVPADPLTHEAERLLTQASAKFRIHKKRETETDGYFVRHALFPRVIKSLYRQSCTVCRISAATPRKTLVQAAHIMDFAESLSDDPQNGIALCPNHHWAFDAGGIGIADDYTLVVSGKLDVGDGFSRHGTPLLLPDQAHFAPAREALAWHREHKFLG